MKTSTLLASFALAFAASGAVLADGATYEYPQPIVGGKSRAEVRAELDAARADGSMKVWSTSYNHLAVAKSMKSRDDVRAEMSAARGIDLTGEDSGSFALARQPQAQQPSTLFARAAK